MRIFRSTFFLHFNKLTHSYFYSNFHYKDTSTLTISETNQLIRTIYPNDETIEQWKHIPPIGYIRRANKQNSIAFRRQMATPARFGVIKINIYALLRDGNTRRDSGTWCVWGWEILLVRENRNKDQGDFGSDPGRWTLADNVQLVFVFRR